MRLRRGADPLPILPLEAHAVVADATRAVLVLYGGFIAHALRFIRHCREEIVGASDLGCVRLAFARDFAGFVPTTSLTD